MSEWTRIALYTGLALGVGIGMQLVGRLFGPKRYHRVKADPYECGVPPLQGARDRFPVHFYLVAILFILFDIETVFLIPWAVMSGELHTQLGPHVLTAVFVFLGIVIFGLVYEARRGALEWE